MTKPMIWLAALALAVAMSAVWGDDDAASAVAEDRTDAIRAAQAAARHDAVASGWKAQGVSDAR